MRYLQALKQPYLEREPALRVKLIKCLFSVRPSAALVDFPHSQSTCTNSWNPARNLCSGQTPLNAQLLRNNEVLRLEFCCKLLCWLMAWSPTSQSGSSNSTLWSLLCATQYTLKSCLMRKSPTRLLFDPCTKAYTACLMYGRSLSKIPTVSTIGEDRWAKAFAMAELECLKFWHLLELIRYTWECLSGDRLRIPAGFALPVNGDGFSGAGVVHDSGVDALISRNVGIDWAPRRPDCFSVVLISDMFCYTYWKYRRCKIIVAGVPPITLTKDSKAANDKETLQLW